MWTDPIVEELHHLREAHAARFHHDLRAMVEDLRALEPGWPAPKIDPPPRPPARTPRTDTLATES
jgi:hypothetical protein